MEDVFKTDVERRDVEKFVNSRASNNLEETIKKYLEKVKSEYEQEKQT
jgi:hypothetical protein